MTEHVLLVPFPEVAEVVEPWLEQTCEIKPSHGVPPHVTLLYPAPPEPEAIAELLSDVAAFDVDFRATDRFPDVVYLAPEPAGRFSELTDALAERFPAWPPYGGAFAEIVPHLTVAQTLLGEAEDDVRSRLPLRARAREAVLLRGERGERWEPIARLPFRGP